MTVTARTSGLACPGPACTLGHHVRMGVARYVQHPGPWVILYIIRNYMRLCGGCRKTDAAAFPGAIQSQPPDHLALSLHLVTVLLVRHVYLTGRSKPTISHSLRLEA